uniref:Uncharacterized protein n=2 Tax=Amphimedon queenslandica TaxID=400682 RepID=A0A1X7TIY1_AMPQE
CYTMKGRKETNTNASKSVLLVKEDCDERACNVFEGSDVVVKTDGLRLLGSPVGSESFISGFIKQTVDKWIVDLSVLCTFAESQPQATCCIQSWCGLNIVSKLYRYSRYELISIGIISNPFWPVSPTTIARSQYRASRDITQPLVDCLLSGNKDIPFEVFKSHCKVIEEYLRKKRNDLKEEKQKVRDCLSSDKQRLLDVACERGASVWLSALPLSDHGFDLNKGSFRDSICIRYGWQLQDLPSSCVCDSSFTVDHALSCPMGGFPTLRHNELRDVTASLMSEVCSNVSREPALQPISGESHCFHCG